MVLSDISIKRPVFATVLSLLLVVLGIAAFQKLPVREYPAIDPPIVSVTTVYKGAANQVVETRVTEIIEGVVAGIEGVHSFPTAPEGPALVANYCDCRTSSTASSTRMSDTNSLLSSPSTLRLRTSSRSASSRD